MIITMMKKLMIAIRITPTGTAMAIASVVVGRPVWDERREWWSGGVVGGCPVNFMHLYSSPVNAPVFKSC